MMDIQMLRIVAGQDRVKEFDKLSQNYNGQLYQFDNMEVVSSGDRDPDAEVWRVLSSSRMRLAAMEGDGHGGWYDRSTGEFVAKTEKGRLKFYNKRQKVGGKDPAQTEKEKNISDPNFVDPKLQQQDPQQAQQPATDQQQQQQQVQSPDLVAGPPPVPKTKVH